MKKIPLEKIAEICFRSMLLILLLLLAGIYLNRDLNEKDYSSGEIDYLEDINVQRYAVKDYKGIRRVYNFVPKEDLSGGTSLCIHLRHQFARVYVSGKLIASVEESEGLHFGRDPGNRWLTVPLTKDLSGKLMRVEVISFYSGYKEPEILIIHRDQLITRILDRELAASLMSIFAIIGGIFLLIDAAALPVRNMRPVIITIGILSLEIGIWKFCGLEIAQILLYKYTKGLYYTGIMSAFMVPGSALTLLNYSVSGKHSKYVIQWCVVISELLTATAFALQLFQVIELHSLIIPFLAECVILLVIAFAYLIMAKERTLMIMPFAAACAADIAVFIITGSSQYSMFVLVWIIIFSVISLSRLIRESIRKDDELRESRITALMNQIRPHFVHNTLTSVYYLCETDPHLAQEVLLNFTRYLQGNFRSISKKEPVPFSDELEQVQAYIAVEQARFSGELEIEYDTEYTGFRLPALTLQPIVENSVKHGVGKGISPEKIIIRTRKENGCAVMSVLDNGPGFDPSAMESAGSRDTREGEYHTGLRNVRDRLELMCGGKLEIKNRPEGGTEVVVTVPEIQQTRVF